MTFLLDERKISIWAYLYCKDIKDDPEVRKFITYSSWAFWYCLEVNDDPEVRKNITNPVNAYSYCKSIKDDPKLRKIAEKGGYRL